MDSVLFRSKQTIPSRFAYVPDRQRKPRPPGSERRRHRRFPTAKSAEIIDGEERPSCVILNISHGGAALRLPGQQVPNQSTFKLKLEPGTILKCEVCWGLGDKLGVRFPLDGLGFGVKDYLVKPFSKNELMECMGSVLFRSKQTIPSRFADDPDRQRKPRPPGSERRQHRRFPAAKSAEIIDGEERPSCVILNISHGGAALRLPGQQVPNQSTFKLKLEPGTILKCEVCWGLGDKLGVRFI